MNKTYYNCNTKNLQKINLCDSGFDLTKIKNGLVGQSLFDSRL